MRILVVEDDRNAAETLRRTLAAQGWAVDVVHDGDSGLARGTHGDYHAVVLDIILPAILSIGDLGQQFAPKDIATLVEDGLEAGFHGFAPEPLEQFRHAPCAHHAGLDLAVEIGR